MSERREVGGADLDALMYRMLGGLLLGGAAVLIGLALLLSTLPRLAQEGGSVLLLPGPHGRHMISAVAIPVVGGAGLVLGLPGAACLMLARRRVAFRAGPAAADRPRRSRRPVLVLVAGLALLAVALLRHRF